LGTYRYSVEFRADAVARGTELADQLLTLAPNGADAVFDTAGPAALNESAAALHPAARQASIAAPHAPAHTKEAVGRLRAQRGINQRDPEGAGESIRGVQADGLHS
jgi:NADPH:quinone reductase-like Zn-dependent oxidoreductase